MRRAGIVLLVTLLFGCDMFESTSESEHISRAEGFIDSGEFNSASIELKNALSKNPDNPEARWLLGKIYLEVGNAAGAEKELSMASRLGVVDQSVLPLLARALLAQGKNREVLDLGKNVSFASDTAAELWAVRGLAYLAENDLTNASEELARALKANPDSAYVLVANAGLMARKRDFEAADTLVEKALEIDRNYALALSYQGDLRQFQNKKEEAVQSYSKAIEARVDNSSDLLKRAMLYIQLKEYESAEKDIAILDRQLGEHPRVSYAKGLLFYQQRKLPEAQEHFEAIPRGDTKYTSASYLLGMVYYLQGLYVQSEERTSAFLAENPNYPPAIKLLALLKLKQGKNEDAESLMRPVIAWDSQDVMALDIMADALLAQGKTEQAVKVLEAVVALQPEVANAKLRLGASLVKQGDKEAGFEEISAAIELDPGMSQADSLLILGYIRENELDKARAAAESFVKRNPGSALAYNLLGMTLFLKQDVANAEKAFEQAADIAPGDPTACSNLAAIALRNFDPDRARSFYKEILDKQPGYLPTLLQLAKLESAEGNRETAKSILQKASEANPSSIIPRVQLAREYLSEGNPDVARATLGGGQLNDPNDPRLLEITGEIQLADKEFQDAKLSFERLVQLQPGVAHYHYLLAKALGGLNARDQMEKELGISLELEPNHVLARVAMAKISLAKGDIDVAREHVARLKDIAVANVEVRALEAGILAGSGDTRQAMDVYRGLYESSPSLDTLLVLTRFLWENGERQESVSRLEKWLEEHRDDVPVRQELANRYNALGRRDDAAALNMEILEHSENNALALNDLAWYLRKSDPGQALVYAERASKIAPGSLAVMDTLAVVLMENGDLARAERLIERILDKAPGNPYFLYHQAMLMQERGQKQEAIRVLESLLKAEAGSFPERTEAENMLERLRRGS